MIERRLGAGTHELFHPDLDGLDAEVVVKVRDGMVGHGKEVPLGSPSFKHVCREAATMTAQTGITSTSTSSCCRPEERTMLSIGDASE
jgi:hypothetical protein